MGIELTKVEAPSTFRAAKTTPYDFIADTLAEHINGQAFNFPPDPDAGMTPDQIIGRIRRLANGRYTPKAKVEDNGTITIQAVTKQQRPRKNKTNAKPADADNAKPAAAKPAAAKPAAKTGRAASK